MQRRMEKKADGAKVTEYGLREVQSPVQAKNEFQKMLLSSLRSSQVTVVSAPAGSGKTFVSMSEVADWLKKGTIDKIILTRPSVGMGNTLGLLKGGMRDKFEPYLLALVDVISNRYGYNYYENCLSNKKIEFVPLEYIRGRSFENAVVIIDEFQNVKPDEAYTIITRLGENSKMVCMGDTTQNDLRGKTGLEWLVNFVDDNELDEYVTIVEGTSDDIVRSGLCRAMVKAREKELGYQ